MIFAMPIDSIHMFLLLYFIVRSEVAYHTVIVAMRCVIVSINQHLSIYLLPTEVSN